MAMADKTAVKKHHEPLIHIVKRDDLPAWQAWLIRGATILAALVFVGFLSMLVTEKGFFETYKIMFSGVFGRLLQGSTKMLWKYLQEIAILLCLALALTPAFKMKFWNCGAEGQVLIGGLTTAALMIYLGDKIPTPLLLLIMLLVSVIAGGLWGFLPSLQAKRW